MSIDLAAKTPQQICALFQRAMAEGDADAVLALYDSEAVFLDRSGDTVKGRDALRRQLTPMAAARTRFDYVIKQVVEADGIALMHTQWTVTQPGSPEAPMRVHAIEIARRQADASWRWLIGDPFTIAKLFGAP